VDDPPRGTDVSPAGREKGRGGVCGVLVTFNPDGPLLESAVDAATRELDELVLIDNGSRPEAVAAVREILARVSQAEIPRARISPRYFDRNRGLPVAFNEAIRMARAGGHDFLLLLDQDSVLRPDAVRALLDVYARWNARVPIGALEGFNEEPTVLPTDDFLEGYLRRHGPPLEPGLDEDYLATNSGLFIPLARIDEVGGFDESFFLDAVDFEFGLRLRSHGFRLLRVAGARIGHRRGEPTDLRLGPFKGAVRRVSPSRHYYVARDVMRTFRRYGRRFPLIGAILFSMPFREAGLVVLFYPNRWTHLRYIGLGLLHSVEGITGQFPPPASG
jgi:GT2 family glycosyltransferase